VHDYEILLLLDPDLPEERSNEILARIRELVESGGGQWLAHEPWGRRKLAYEIGKKGEGTYHLLTFDAEPATLDEITRVLKITDGVMRHMPTRRLRAGGRATARAAVGSGAGGEYAAASESEPQGGEA
jgi:small subunit ribosomal protein S6